MLDVVAECRKRGLPIALITNNVRPMSDDPGASWVYDEFDVVVESSVEGTRKPEEGSTGSPSNGSVSRRRTW